jgi:glutathione S-transferase
MTPADTPQLELYQAEWCPYSHRVRMRLTELGVDVVLRQVAADRTERTAMGEATGGVVSIPTLLTPAGLVSGLDEIIAWLDERYPERADVERHRAKRRADWPLWVELHGPGGALA